MLLRQFMLDVGPLETNSWLLADESSGEALLIDAGAYSPDCAELIHARHLRLTHILLTHLHWDHVEGLPVWTREFPDALLVAPAQPKEVPAGRVVSEGDQLQAGPFSFSIFDLSGHTPESIGYHCAAAGICFVGDAIFAGSVGGTTSDALFEQQKSHLVGKILTLPPETQLLPGHGPATTVAIEQAANPFLKPGFGRK